MYCVDVVVRFFGLGWSSYSANGWNMFDIVVAAGSLFTTLVVRFNTGGFVIQQLQKLFITSIALKLVQRVNSLNKLFKTAVYVLSSAHTVTRLISPLSTVAVYPSSSVCLVSGLSSSCSSQSSLSRFSV